MSVEMRLLMLLKDRLLVLGSTETYNWLPAKLLHFPLLERAPIFSQNFNP
jgi:hypothetical protein